METIQTPTKDKSFFNNEVLIPASPFMKCLGFGTGVSVYKLNRSPICTNMRSPWAIKKIQKYKNCDEKRNILKNEAKILQKLKHPNIIGFRALAKDSNGEICLAMEVCKVSLGDMIEERNEMGLLAFPPLNITKVACDISKALNYLHNEAFILHCDIKSYNILVQDNFIISKLCDFGISLPLQQDGTVSNEYLSEDICLGTGPWMSPEAHLYGVVTSKSDVYSYGLVIWEMLALIVPPQNEDDNSSLEISELIDSDNSSFESDSCGLKKLNWRPELPAQQFTSDYNIILELFSCCTEKNPEYRPSADLLQKASEEILNLLTK